MAPLEGDTFCAQQKKRYPRFRPTCNQLSPSIRLLQKSCYAALHLFLSPRISTIPARDWRLISRIVIAPCPLFQIQYLVPGIRRLLFEISWHTYNTSLAREATVATRWTTIRASPTACKVQGVLQTRQCLKKYPVKFGAVPYHTTAMYCTHYVITYGRSSFSAGRMKIFSAISRFRSRCATRFVQGSFPLWTARYVWFHWRHPNRVEKIRL